MKFGTTIELAKGNKVWFDTFFDRPIYDGDSFSLITSGPTMFFARTSSYSTRLDLSLPKIYGLPLKFCESAELEPKNCPKKSLTIVDPSLRFALQVCQRISIF